MPPPNRGPQFVGTRVDAEVGNFGTLNVDGTQTVKGPMVVQSLTAVGSGPNTPDPLIALGGWHIGNGYLISPPPNGTDDTSSLNNILAAVPASGGEVVLQPGLYKAPTGGLTCANPVSIEGRGTGIGSSVTPYWQGGSTGLLVATGSVAALTLLASGSWLKGFSLLCSDVPVAGGVGISVPAGTGMGNGNGNRYEDVAVRGFYTDMDIQDGTEWFMDKCFLYDYGLYGIKVANATNGDAGDMGIINSLIYGGPTNLHPGAGMRYESGGGMRLTGSKFNYRGSPANYPDHCIDMAIADGVSSGEFEITGGGLSAAQVACLRLHLAGTTGVWSGITVAGALIGPFSTNGRAIQADPPSTGKIADITITGNTIRAVGGGQAYPLSLINVARVGIAGNTYPGVAGAALSPVLTGVTSLLVAPGDKAGIGPTTDQPTTTNSAPGNWYYDTTLGKAQYAEPSIVGTWVMPRGSRKASLTYSTSITPVASGGDWRTITVTDGVAFTINAPTSPPDTSHTQELTIEISNTSGGAMGVITWNAAFFFAGQVWTNPANANKRFARFEWNGAHWICTSIAAADYS